MDSHPSGSSSSPLVPPILRRQYRQYNEQCASRGRILIPSMLDGLQPSKGSHGLFGRDKGDVCAPTSTQTSEPTPQPQRSLPPRPPPTPTPESDTYIEPEEDRKAREQVEHLSAKLFRNSPMIRFMTRQLQMVGCDPYHRVDLKSNPNATPRLAIQSCPGQTAGGFTPSEEGQPYNNAGIVICANHIMDKQHLEQTLAHEMIHWWDHCRFRVDWRDLRQHACSEIRAASLSGDCKYSMEAMRDPLSVFRIVKRHQECVRRRAVLSLVASGACPEQTKAETVVDEVFDSCFKDTRPFDEIY